MEPRFFTFLPRGSCMLFLTPRAFCLFGSFGKSSLSVKVKRPRILNKLITYDMSLSITF